MLMEIWDTDPQVMPLRTMIEQSQANLNMSIQMALLENRLRMVQDNCCYDGSDRHPGKTNCINCGASLSGRHSCEYCGTYNK